jgi:thiamine biosynthesis lipoprotein
MWQWSDGFFDPTVGAALEAAGYDASFERLPTDRPDASVGQPSSSVSFADVRLDPGDVSITLPAGVRIDLGGIGKGYLLDAVQRRAQTITEDYWLSFGGDLFVSGRDDENQSWRIAVQSAEHLEEDIGLLEAPAGQWAISTSGTTKRKGVRAGRAWHHLINPRTMQPSDSPVLAVTALARSALEADVAAKTILLRGPEDGLNWARSKSIEALLQLPRANFIMTPAMRSIFQAQQ